MENDNVKMMMMRKAHRGKFVCEEVIIVFMRLTSLGSCVELRGIRMFVKEGGKFNKFNF